MTDDRTYFRIARWLDIYDRQPKADPEAPPKKKVDRTREPMSWVQLQVHGHELGEGWRDLQALCGPQTLAAFGLFCKLLELAADEPKEMRDGTIYSQGRPASAERIAFLVNSDVEVVAGLLSCLVRAGWVEELRADAESCAQLRADAKSCAQLRADERLDRNRNREGELEQETETETETEKETDRLREDVGQGDLSVSASGTIAPEPATPAELPSAARNEASGTSGMAECATVPADASEAVSDATVKRVRLEVARDVALHLRIHQRDRREFTTVYRAVSHATAQARSAPELDTIAATLVGLAKDKTTSATLRNPRAAWTAAVVERWGPWTEATGPPVSGPDKTTPATLGSV